MIDTDLIRSAVSVPDAARFYGYEPNRAGFICCPFHSEKTPSMKLYRRRFKCFGGCGQSGDVIDFVSRILNLPFRDAVARLNADFRLGIDLSAPIDTDQLRAHRAAQIERERRRAEWAAEYGRRSDEYRRLCAAKRDKRPQAVGDWHTEYVEALHRLDYLEWWLDENLEFGG